MHKKIKVVFVINNFLVGGVERFLFDIISYFDKNKYDIQIITVLGSGPLEASFKDLGVSIYHFGVSDSFTRKLPKKISWLLTTLVAVIRITFFLLKSKPDVVFTSLFQGDVIGMTASKIAGVKKRILIQHDTVKFRKFIRLVKKNFALKFTTQVVSVSNTVKSFLVDYFEVDSKKIIVILNGIDYRRFEQGRKELVDFNNLVIGIIGRLEEIKGHIYVLEALKILRDEYKLLPKVLLAGDGSLRRKLEEYVSLNKLDNVSFLGDVSNIPDFLSKIDISIVPSISEGFGLVSVEGMVAGKVVIASRIGAACELINDNNNGLLFESQNSNSLADVLLNVLKNKEILERLQKNAISFSLKNRNIFDICEISKTYQDLTLAK